MRLARTPSLLIQSDSDEILGPHTMARYLALKPYFVRGEFIGIDELTHLHVLPGQPGGVLVAFNLDKERQVSREVVVPLSQVNLSRKGKVQVEGADFELKGEDVVLRLKIPAESALVVTLRAAAPGPPTAEDVARTPRKGRGTVGG